jgi:hypothetical protein
MTGVTCGAGMLIIPEHNEFNPGFNHDFVDHYGISVSQMTTDMLRGNQKPYIEKEQTTQWPKEKVQKDKQRSTKHAYKTKDRDCIVCTYVF